MVSIVASSSTINAKNAIQKLPSCRTKKKGFEGQEMGRPQSADDKRCRWHPKHKQSTGVCPFCVRQKLQLLTASPFSACSSYSAYVLSSTASSSPCSDESDASSSASSPRRRYHCIDRAKRRKEETPGNGKLKKSRSLVFSIGGRNELVTVEGNKKKGNEKEKGSKKKGRFWSKLLLRSSRRRDREEVGGGCLRHSQTFKENTSATWAL